MFVQKMHSSEMPVEQRQIQLLDSGSGYKNYNVFSAVCVQVGKPNTAYGVRA